MLSSMPGASVAGPTVAMILVRLICRADHKADRRSPVGRQRNCRAGFVTWHMRFYPFIIFNVYHVTVRGALRRSPARLGPDAFVNDARCNVRTDKHDKPDE